MEEKSYTTKRKDGFTRPTVLTSMEEIECALAAIRSPEQMDMIRVWERSTESIVLAAVMGLNPDTSNSKVAVCCI
jgi:hypothetical protein